MCKNAYTVYLISYIVYVYNILPNKNNSKIIFKYKLIFYKLWKVNTKVKKKKNDNNQIT